MKIIIKFLCILSFGTLLSSCAHHSSINGSELKKAAEARVAVAIAYLDNNNFDLAKVSLDKALQYDKDYYLTYLVFARYYQLLGNTSKVNESFSQAISKDNKQGIIYNNYGAFLCQDGKYNQAFMQFLRALSAPNFHKQAQTYQNIALCAYQAKDSQRLQQAMVILEKLSPSRAKELSNLFNNQ